MFKFSMGLLVHKTIGTDYWDACRISVILLWYHVFITPILKSLVVYVIWFALIDAIYSWIAPFFFFKSHLIPRTKFSQSHLKKSQSCRKKGHLGDFNGKVLTNVNFKNLTEQLGFRGRQEHHEGAFLDVLHHNFYYNNKNWRSHSCAV